MNKIALFYFFLACILTSFAQTNKFESLLQRNLKHSVPTFKVADLDVLDTYLIFDAREKIEYQTSHLKNARHIGYNYFAIDSVLQKHSDRSKKIIVYCSIGVRSELIGEKLLNAGYENVYNLYGGIFEWKNQSREVIDKDGAITERVHTYSKEWSKWLTNGIKVYER